MLCNDSSSHQYGMQFHQFTVEEEQQQLVLKVTNCTHVALPGSSAASAVERCSVADAESGTTSHGPSEAIGKAGNNPTSDMAVS